MSFKELRRDLQAILPEGHPFLKRFDESLTPNMVIAAEAKVHDPNESHLQRLIANVVDSVDDWKRGIRDWAEVEREINEMRDEVKET